ncbi:MAG: PilZ domain-containing protein, partial [Spirochaetales bacterium]
MSEAESMAGKKIFLLNPPSVVQNELIQVILAAEYEVYLLYDAQRAHKAFARHPDSIVFVNIDSGNKNMDWEPYVRELAKGEKYPNLKVGVLSYNSDRALIQRYLMDIGVQCGFVALKLGVKESAKIILQALEANEARGRRKYVRVKTGEDPRVAFNVDLPTGAAFGRILDISSVGMAIQFAKPVKLPPKSVLANIQLKLRAVLVRTDGVILGAREDDPSVFVILFKYRPQETKPRQQIRMFIHKALQES